MGTPIQAHLPFEQEIEIDELSFLMRQFAEEQRLSDKGITLLLGQIESLREVYGRYINKALAYQIVAKQWEVTQTGYVQEPVDIIEFVESPQYMNQGAYVRPVILEHLFKLFEDEYQYYEVVLGGAIGIGKNYFADMAVAYILYKMSCLLSPQAHYGLAPGSEIVFVHQSKTLQLARKVVFNQFAGRLRASGYFPKYFRFSSMYRAQMNFPSNISVIPISSSDSAALGMNIFCFPEEQQYLMADGNLSYVVSTGNTTKKTLAIDEKNYIMPSEYDGAVYSGESELVRLHFENGDTIDCTPHHPFRGEGNGKIRAVDAEGKCLHFVDEQDMLHTGYLQGSPCKVQKLRCVRVERLEGKVPVYDVTNVKKTHYFFAKTQSGFLVAHNTAVMDELNFMTRTKRSKGSNFTGEADYDQAMKLYSEIYGRVESRYMSLGRVPGKIFLISSANYEGDFISRKEAEAEQEIKDEGKSHIYVMHLSQWEALPQERFSGKKFWVMLPTDKFKGRVLDEEPESKTRVIEVPIEYKKSFNLDLYKSLRTVGGISVARHNRVLDTLKIEEAFVQYATIYGDDQIFRSPSMVFGDVQILEPILNLDFLRKLRDQGPFGAHADLALTNNSAGIAIGHVAGSKDIGTRTVFDTKKGTFVRQAYGNLPIYSIVGLLKIDPPLDGGEIDLNAIRDMFFLIGDYIPLRRVTFDRFQSAALMQSFRARKIASYVVSVDKNPQPYMEAKHAFAEQRAMVPRHRFFEEEASELEQDSVSGKVDHMKGGQKDVSDAVTAVIYEFSRKLMSYRKKGAPVKLSGEGGKMLQASVRPSTTIRPSSGRELLY